MTASEVVTQPVWAASTLNVDQEKTLDYLARATPVRLIGTFDNLVTVRSDDLNTEAIEKAQPRRFDFLPVTEKGTSTIIALLSIADAMKITSAKVSDVMTGLSGRNLIAADAPLLHFIYSADERPCRLILDGEHITGLVTLSDLQKLPVRMALFSLLIHLEILLTELLRRVVKDPDQPFDMLSPSRACEARKRWQTYKDRSQDALAALELSDKRVIAMKCRIMSFSVSRIKSDFEKIERLRNPLAHGSDYAKSESEAQDTVRAAKLMRDWIKMLREELSR
jgi:CBS domain-containing protein